MKIMYLTDVGFDTPNSNNRLVLSMLHEFLKAGHEVYLVQSHSTGTYEDVPEILKKYKNFTYDTIKKAVVRKTNFVKRYLNGLKYEYNAQKKWKKEIDSVDIVLLQSHYTAWYAAWLLRKSKSKLVFNIYDIFPGEAYTNGNIKSKFIYDCLAFCQKYLYKKCDFFFVISKDMKQTLQALGVSENKIGVVPVWFDKDNIYEIFRENNKFAYKYNLDKSKKYIQYAGSIGVAYDFNFVIDVAKELQYRKDLVFQIVGEGIKLDQAKKRVKELKLQNVIFLPWQPLEILSDVYSFCSLQIIPMMKDVIRNSYPSKILPLMGCARVPVISVEEDSLFFNEINKEKVGLTSPIGDVNKMVTNILYLIDNDNILKEYQRNAVEYVHKKFTAEINTGLMIKKFIRILKMEN